MSSKTPIYESNTTAGLPVTVRLSNLGFNIYVGGWRVATLKTIKGAIRRADREAAKVGSVL